MRTTRKGVSKAFWLDQRSRFCYRGKQWARRFPTAGAAWKACNDGMFIAWWLCVSMHTTSRGELLRLRKQTNRSADTVFCDVYGEANRAFAAQLKSLFRVDGTRRT